MSGQSSHRSRSFYPQLASISPTDPGMYGSTREMGPPPLDWPPQPVEIDLNSSRTLPSPSASVSAPNAWDSSLLQPHGFGELSYGSSNGARLQQLPMDNQNRASAPDPLAQWYMGNDGPWIPKVIPEIVPEDRSQSRQTSNRSLLSYAGQYKAPNPSDGGSFQFGVPHSDSGYGTRRSVGNTSVFSADVPERDQDCQSVAGQVTDFQQFHGLNDVFPRDGRTNDQSWSHPTSSLSDSSGLLVCPTCHKPVKTQSELKKHDLRHRKPFVCTVLGCTRTEGFSTTNDLDRHTKSKHPSAISETAPTKKYRCHVPGCKSKEKSWPRLDNFRSHLKRVHGNQMRNEDDFDDLIRRGEFWERNGLATDQELPQRPTLPEPSRTMKAIIHETVPSHKPEPNWKPLYPEVIEPSQDLIVPKGPQSGHVESKVATTNDNSPSDIPQQETVQPLEVFRPQGRIHETRIALDNVLAPAGQIKSPVAKAEPASPQSVPRGNAPSKAPRQNQVSASDATLEVIKTALAGANIADASPNRGMQQDSDRNHLPNGRVSSRDSWPLGPNSATGASRGVNGHLKSRDAPSPEEEARDSEAQKKALEVLKVLRELGYTVQRDPSHSPKAHNVGSAASNRSENQVTCQTCKRFKGRPCELKKHMKRHERPYGCTFLTCNKIFGSKNDWKRHENSQHFHLETWRCDEERPEGGACAKVCYRRQTFSDHLVKAHQISDNDALKAKLDTCRIGRNCQARFWCGFCNKLVELKKKGVEAWTERFDHIDDHFMGRHGLPKQSIQDWVPMDSDRPKGEVESPHSLSSPDEENHAAGPSQSAAGSPAGNSPESKASTGGSPDHAISLDEDNAGTKRRRSSSGDDGSQRQKRAKSGVKSDTVVYCCQCTTPHNPRIDLRCTGCDGTPHVFCSNCKVERLPPQV